MNNDIKILFGKRVRELRLKKSLTQEQLAEALSIAERNVSKIECGDNFPRAEKLSKLALILGVSVQELFDFSHFKETKNLTDEIIELINSHPEKLTDIYKVVKALTI